MTASVLSERAPLRSSVVSVVLGSPVSVGEMIAVFVTHRGTARATVSDESGNRYVLVSTRVRDAVATAAEERWWMECWIASADRGLCAGASVWVDCSDCAKVMVASGFPPAFLTVMAGGRRTFLDLLLAKLVSDLALEPLALSGWLRANLGPMRTYVDRQPCAGEHAWLARTWEEQPGMIPGELRWECATCQQVVDACARCDRPNEEGTVPCAPCAEDLANEAREKSGR